MADYSYDPNDGKLHTRYSELAMCTPGNGVKNAVLRRFDMLPRVETEYMAFGTERHEMWAEEALKTGKTAACFGVQFEATHIEREFAANVLPSVVMHMRPDVVSEPAQAVIDYKTLFAESYDLGKIRAETTYSKSKQLIVYAYILMIFAIWVGKKFVSVTLLKWYISWQRKQFQQEMYDKLFTFCQRKYKKSKREADEWARETMLCDVSSILEFLEREDR